MASWPSNPPKAQLPRAPRTVPATVRPILQTMNRPPWLAAFCRRAFFFRDFFAREHTLAPAVIAAVGCCATCPPGTWLDVAQQREGTLDGRRDPRRDGGERVEGRQGGG